MAVKLGYGYEICAFLDAVDSSEAEGITTTFTTKDCCVMPNYADLRQDLQLCQKYYNAQKADKIGIFEA